MLKSLQAFHQVYHPRTTSTTVSTDSSAGSLSHMRRPVGYVLWNTVGPCRPALSMRAHALPITSLFLSRRPKPPPLDFVVTGAVGAGVVGAGVESADRASVAKTSIGSVVGNRGRRSVSACGEVSSQHGHVMSVCAAFEQHYFEFRHPRREPKR